MTSKLRMTASILMASRVNSSDEDPFCISLDLLCGINNIIKELYASRRYSIRQALESVAG